MIFQKVPEAYQINDLIKQKNYLVNGELKSWSGKMTDVYSTISSTEDYQPTLLGSVPELTKVQALEALDAASKAYNNGQGIWPTMKVADRISCMEKFSELMKTKRSQVFK
jgi:glyceraldehyde-3-phosphate dehydrogenase (NADP+)